MVPVKVIKISYHPTSRSYAIILKEIRGEKCLPVIVGSFEAQSIALAIESVDTPRPLTHDLICDFITGFGEDVVDLFDGPDLEMPPIPEIQMQPTGPAAIPQIKTIGGYGPGSLATNPYGLSGGSGSAGFITGKQDGKENIYQQANIS